MRKYVKEIDVYSGIAIFFVVLIHANGGYLSALNKSSLIDVGYFLLTIDQIIKIAVPMFIFAAGFKYHLSKQQVYKTYLTQRLTKVLIPFLIISLFFIIKESVTTYALGNEGIKSTLVLMVIKTIKTFLGENIAYQLWYIPVYLVVVLSYPIIKKYVVNQKFRFLLFGTLSIIYIPLRVFAGFNIPYFCVHHLFVYELGCYVAENRMNKANYKLFVSYLSILLISIFTAKSAFGALITQLFLVPVSVVTFYYVSVYLKDNQILNKLGKYSFYIFLFHEPVILSYLTNVFKKSGLYTGYQVTLVITILTIVLSIAFYEFLKKIGLAKYIFYQKRSIIKNSTYKKNPIISMPINQETI